MALGSAQRDAKEAEQRHFAHERRLLADVDLERVAARQAAAELAKEQKARAADREAARATQETAEQALRAEKAAHREAAANWLREQQEMQVELTTLRERAPGGEQRSVDLTAQLHRHQEQAEREIAQLRESQAATAAALRQIEAGRGKSDADAEKPPSNRAARSRGVGRLSGEPSSFDTRRALARAFAMEDIDGFNKPFVRITAEEMTARQDKFDREHITLAVSPMESGRAFAGLAETTELDFFHAAFDMERVRLMRRRCPGLLCRAYVDMRWRSL